MDQQSVLALGAFTLIACAGGLFASYSGNPLLRGLNWMGLALVSGAFAAVAFLLGLHHPPAEPVGDLFLLLAFLSGNYATRVCVGDTKQRSAVDSLLVALQIGTLGLVWTHVWSLRISGLELSLVLAVSMERTARMLSRSVQKKSQATTLFVVVVLRVLLVPDLLRGVGLATGWLDARRTSERADSITYSFFIAGAVSFAFSFFARTTTNLTEKLEYVASTDPLTRVFNRRAFLSWCEKEWSRSLESSRAFSILLVDLDHFKQVNDQFGHHAGDSVLCLVVEHIQNAIRGVDVLCRWGGEEFAVLLPNATSHASSIVAHRIGQNVRTFSSSSQLASSGLCARIQLTVSIGAGTWNGPNDTIDAMLRRADAALYAAKAGGRDCVVLDNALGNLATQQPAGEPVLT